MGRVYLGYSPAGRAVAIKVVHPELARNEEFLARFRNEVTAARAVSGLYTAPVVASGLDDNPPWLATVYVPGPALDDVIARNGPLPEPALWRLAAGLAEALQAVHDSGLVHRDLKPSNVLLAADGPHVIDFGISRAMGGTHLTATGMVVGTPGYMSPEQAEGQEAGTASDVFSLACVVAYAASGKQPFGSGSAASVLYRVVAGQPDLDGVPARLREVLEACLRKIAAQRPPLPAVAAAFSREAGMAGQDSSSPASFWPPAVAEIIRGAAEGASAAPGMASATASPQSPVPRSPVPQSPVPQSPVPQSPVPQSPVPQSPVPQSPVPSYPAPRSPVPQSPVPQSPVPQSPVPQSPVPSYPSPGAPSSYQPPSYLQTPPPGQDWGPTPGWPGSPGPQAPVPGVPWQPAGSQPAQGMQAPGIPARSAQYPQAGYSTPVPYQPSAQQPAVGQPGGQQPPGAQPPGYPPSAPPMPSGAVPHWSGPPAGQPGLAGQHAYRPARRKPTLAELPSAIVNALRIVYAGLGASVLAVIMSIVDMARLDHQAAIHLHVYPALSQQESNSLGLIFIFGFGVGIIGLVMWPVCARAVRKGRQWGATVGTVLFGLDVAPMLFVVFFTHDASLTKAFTTLAWALGLVAVVLLWNSQSRAYYRAFR
jgi:serine/threonine protein kinase